MSIDWGYTVPPDEGGGDVMHALADADAPRHSDKTPLEWIKSNLFNTWYNTLITIVFGAIALVAGYYGLRFVFVTARWEPVRANLELFMIGTFPRAERTRIIVQVLLGSGALGLFLGWIRKRSITQAEEAGIERVRTPLREYLGLYWALAAFILTCLIVGARTIDPWLLTIGCVAAGIAGFESTTALRNPAAKLILATPLVITAGVLTRVEDLDNQAAYLIGGSATALLIAVHFIRSSSLTLSAAAVTAVASFQALSGTGGMSWFFLTLALLPVTMELLTLLVERVRNPALGWVGVGVLSVAFAAVALSQGLSITTIILFLFLAAAVLDAVRGGIATSVRAAGVVVLAVFTWWVANILDVSGIDWEKWSGLHLNLVVSGAAIVLAFPIGLLLALGRRSSLPVVRWLSTAYIELIRGVPLISLLLMGQFFIGFFLNSTTPLSSVTRATAAVTMFSAAYIAEIVRGGLQAVDKGQTEAGQAVGLPPAKITRLIVLPQALRAVIPAMVGQFISLFKDTSLLSIIGVLEFVGVREIVHSQEAFRGFGIAETLVFVAFGFWAFSFTMSRESQRLERRLGVGFR
jgi:general L-amino acid transport system permease protein